MQTVPRPFPGAVCSVLEGGIGRSRTSAFTLLELLVVLGIIAVLSSLLLTSLASSKELSRRSRCRSNERQMTIALHLYGGDWEDQLPPADAAAVGPPVLLRTYLPLIATNTQRSLLRYLADSNVLDCPNVHRVLVASNHGPTSWRWPLDAWHLQIGYLYLGGRAATPWGVSGPPIRETWVSPQRLSDDPGAAAFTDLGYVATCVRRIVVAHGLRGPWIQQLAADAWPAGSGVFARVEGAAIAGSHVARLDGSVEWHTRKNLRWYRGAKEFDASDNGTCVAIW